MLEDTVKEARDRLRKSLSAAEAEQKKEVEPEPEPEAPVAESEESDAELRPDGRRWKTFVIAGGATAGVGLAMSSLINRRSGQRREGRGDGRGRKRE